MATLDQLDKRRRAKSLKQTIKDLRAVLDSSAGFRRLASISDAQWNEAEQKDADAGLASKG